MAICCSLPQLLCLVVFACNFWCVSSLSLDDSFLSTSVQRLQKEYSQTIPGIWKLTTNSLPYELDIRSQLDKRFSNDNENDIGSNECILLKLNQDGTFKQFDEGYKEGKWLKGRWKLQLEELSTREDDDDDDRNDNAAASDPKAQPKSNRNHNSVTLSWILLLAMNRQYFGPPFDVLLEATANLTTMATDRSTGMGNGQRRGDTTEEDLPTELSLKQWQGTVRKGKFLRPLPGKHPLDRDSIGTTTNEILENAESLGDFFLEQALSTNSMDRPANDVLWNEEDTFFFPCGSSSSDDFGMFQ